MSRRIQQQQKEQKYCKICHDSGKSESIYTSHFIRETRDPNSRVVCPTLLALECRYCFKRGHTVKYCPALKNKDQPQRRQEPVRSQEEKKPVEKKTNIYMVLDEEDDVIENVKNDVIDFPALAQAKPTPVSLASIPEISYASIAAREPEPEEKKIEIQEAPIIEPPKAVVRSYYKPTALRWADCESSDDEVEEKKVEIQKVPIIRTTKPTALRWAECESSDDEAEVAYESNMNMYSNIGVAVQNKYIDDDDGW